MEDLHPGKSYWVGIDDRDEDDEWITSLNMIYTKSDQFFANGDVGTKQCGFVDSGSSGFVSSSDCSFKKHYVCETEKLDKAPAYPCPNNFIPYKDRCLMPSPQRKTYDSAKVFCATKGGIILPIKDKGILEFIRAWGPRTVRNDLWVGLRKKNYTRIYDKTSTPALQESITDELAYSDGQSFDIDKNYKMEAKILRGECFALKSSSDMELRDYKCNREIGFVCEWIRPMCPKDESDYEYSYLGQLSSGRDCIGIGKAASFLDGTCNSDKDLLRSRWTPNSRYEIDVYRRDYGQVYFIQ